MMRKVPDGAAMVAAMFAATLAALLGVATRQTRLPPSFPAAFGVKCVVSLPVALCGQSGPTARDAAATELEGLCVLHEGEILEDEAVGCGLCSALVWAVAQFAIKGAMNVVWMPVLLELVRAAAENDSKGAAIVSLAPVFLELVSTLAAAASFLVKTLGVCEFPGHIWKGDRKDKGKKRFFRVQTSRKCEDQVSSFGILGNDNDAHIVRELWMERQENYICGEFCVRCRSLRRCGHVLGLLYDLTPDKVRTAAACRAAAFEGVLPLFLGFTVLVFVTAMPVQAVATGSPWALGALWLSGFKVFGAARGLRKSFPG